MTEIMIKIMTESVVVDGIETGTEIGKRKGTGIGRGTETDIV